VTRQIGGEEADARDAVAMRRVNVDIVLIVEMSEERRLQLGSRD
jgi:hypothetical protein